MGFGLAMTHQLSIPVPSNPARSFKQKFINSGQLKTSASNSGFPALNSEYGTKLLSHVCLPNKNTSLKTLTRKDNGILKHISECLLLPEYSAQINSVVLPKIVRLPMTRIQAATSPQGDEMNGTISLPKAPMLKPLEEDTLGLNYKKETHINKTTKSLQNLVQYAEDRKSFGQILDPHLEHTDLPALVTPKGVTVINESRLGKEERIIVEDNRMYQKFQKFKPNNPSIEERMIESSKRSIIDANSSNNPDLTEAVHFSKTLKPLASPLASPFPVDPFSIQDLEPNSQIIQRRVSEYIIGTSKVFNNSTGPEAVSADRLYSFNDPALWLNRVPHSNAKKLTLASHDPKIMKSRALYITTPNYSSISPVNEPIMNQYKPLEENKPISEADGLNSSSHSVKKKGSIVSYEHSLPSNPPFKGKSVFKDTYEFNMDRVESLEDSSYSHQSNHNRTKSRVSIESQAKRKPRPEWRSYNSSIKFICDSHISDDDD